MKSIKSKKIKKLKDLAPIIHKMKAKGKRIAHSHGVFDLLHPGHIQHFQEAKSQGDVLVVTITKDQWVNKGPGRPAFNERLRAEAIAALESVDYVAVNDWPTAVKTIKLLRPDVYFKGSDYQNRHEDITGMIFDEEKAVKSVGGVISFTHGITFSSSGIINQYFSVYPEETEGFLDRFKKTLPVKSPFFKKCEYILVPIYRIDIFNGCFTTHNNSRCVASLKNRQ